MSENIDENEKNKKSVLIRIRNFFYLVLILALAIFLLSTYISYKYEQFSLKDYFSKNEERFDDAESEKETIYLPQKVDDIILERLIERVEYLEQNQLLIEDKISRIDISPNVGNIIKVVLSIKEKAEVGRKFYSDLATLRILSKNNENLLQLISQVEQYKPTTNEEIVSDFDVDLKKFISSNNLLVKNDSKISKFFSNFVVVRKTSKLENNSSDKFAANLIDSMKILDYRNVLNYINNSNYKDYFTKTTTNLENRLGLEDALDELIKHVL